MQHPLEPISGRLGVETPEVLPPTRPDTRLSEHIASPPKSGARVSLASPLDNPAMPTKPMLSPPIIVDKLNRELGRDKPEMAAPERSNRSRMSNHVVEPVRSPTRVLFAPSLSAPELATGKFADARNALDKPNGAGIPKFSSPTIQARENGLENAIRELIGQFSGDDDLHCPSDIPRRQVYDPFTYGTGLEGFEE